MSERPEQAVLQGGISGAQLDTLLREALAHLTRREIVAAERLLDIVFSSRPDDPNALYILAQLRHLQNRLSEAQGLYRRTLMIDAARPEIHFHLGQALILSGHWDEAVASFRESIRLRPERAEAHFELGMTLSRKRDFVAAERSYRETLRLQPTLIAARHALSTTLISLGRPKEAEVIARSALPLVANDARWYAAIKHATAIAVSEQHRYVEAVLAYEEVQAIAPSLPFLDHNCANALQASGRLDEAEAMHRRGLVRDPLDLLAHRGLNHLLWRRGRADFLESYDAAAKLHPAQPALFVEKGRLQLLYERNDEARRSFEHALHIAPHDEQAREGLASTLSRLGEFDKAIAEFESIAARFPKNVEIRLGLVECFLRAQKPMRARRAADDALIQAPNNQLALALRNTALRQQGDRLGEDDYENLILAYDLNPPEGYADLESFHRELESYLTLLHGAPPAPHSEGMRAVSRTSGTLFGAGADVVTRLRKHLDQAVAAYVAALPKNGSHAFLRRRDKELRYTGAWSTRVASGGKIASHIHENGWLSGIYFVALPDDVADEKAQKGWTTFGAPPFDAHLAQPVARLIKPAPGRLVLFPSHLWHGSTPFSAPQMRLSVSFDAFPEASRD